MPIAIWLPTGAALQKYRRLLDVDGESWAGNVGAGLRFVQGVKGGIEAAVLEVESLDDAARVLRGLGLAAVRAEEQVECEAHGVRLLLTEEAGDQ